MKRHPRGVNLPFLPLIGGCVAIWLMAAGCKVEMTESDPDVINVGADAGVAALEPTLDNIQAHVFDKACALSGCHAAESAAGDLDLSSADASYAALVEVSVINNVAKENGWLRVKPEDAELSFLVRKIGVPGVGEGAPMPVGTEQLSAYYQELIEAWIDGGAQR
jgi:hypothetical protein